MDLRPLEFSAEADETKGIIRVDLLNPDEHTPQTATILVVERLEGRVAWQSMQKKKVEVSSAGSLSIALPEDVEGDVEVYALPLTAWKHAAFCAISRGEVVNDMKAAGLLAVRFDGDGTCGDMKDARVLYLGTVEGDELIIAASVRGNVDDGGRVLVRYGGEGEMVDSGELQLDDVPPDRYVEVSTTVSREEGLRPEIRFAAEATGELFVSDLLAVNADRDSLEGISEWHKSVIIGDGIDYTEEVIEDEEDSASGDGGGDTETEGGGRGADHREDGDGT